MKDLFFPLSCLANNPKREKDIQRNQKKQMGAWGTGSYDNDSVMDAVGECEDTENPTQEEADAILAEAFGEADNNEEMFSHALGCVVFFLSHGCEVKLEYLQECIDTFVPYELENNDFNKYAEERTESLESESMMIQKEIDRIKNQTKIQSTTVTV